MSCTNNNNGNTNTINNNNNNMRKTIFGYRESIDYIIKLVASPEHTPYAKKLSLEESHPEWAAFRDSLPNREKFSKCYQRIVGNQIHRAREKRMCLYCWMPLHCCSCKYFKDATVDHHHQHDTKKKVNLTLSKNALMNSASSTSTTTTNTSTSIIDLKPVFILHPDEFLSETNSGHAAAMALDAPLIIIGLPGFEAIIKDINHLFVEEYVLYLDRALELMQNVVVKNKNNNNDHCDEHIVRSVNATPLQNNKEEDDDDELLLDRLGLPLDGVEPGFFENVVMKKRINKTNKPKVSILYPEDKCETMEQYIQREIACSSSTSAAEKENSPCSPSCHHQQQQKSHQQTVQSCATTNTNSNNNNHQQFVVHLLDATWQQAHRLNRHIPRSTATTTNRKDQRQQQRQDGNAPPRVSLVIDNTTFGNGMFEPLRKRTRDTGCSTLEATAMAMEQLIVAFDADDQNQNQNNIQQQQHLSSIAKFVSSTLLWNMELFVDLVVTLRHLPTQVEHRFRGGEIAEIVKQCRQNMLEWNATRRQDAQQRKPPTVPIEELKKSGQLAAPIARYCYICEKYIGVNRMEQHCRGTDHATKFEMRKKEEEEEKEEDVLETSKNNNIDGILTRVWYPKREAKNNDAFPREEILERVE